MAGVRATVNRENDNRSKRMSTNLISATDYKSSALRGLWERMADDNWLRVLLLLPTILMLLVFSVYPLVYALYTSLYNYRFGQLTTFAGLANYQEMFTDGAFWGSIGTTLLFAA